MNVLKKNIICICVTAVVMLLLPCLAVTFVKSQNGMFVTLLLFFVINPLCAICTGIFSGKHIKQSWFLPVLCAVFFLAGAWLFFDRHERTFLLYAIVYLGLGCAAMLVSRLVK